MKLQLLYLPGLCLALAGCAHDPAPFEQLRLTDQALEQARTVDANDSMDDYRAATEKMARARAEMASQSYKAARVQAEQAELDARLAEAQLLTAKSEDQLKVVQTRIQRLRTQLKEAP